MSSPKLLLVDFENVQQIDLNRLDSSFAIKIFVGSTQKSIPLEIVTAAQKLGSQIEWVKIEGSGSNALDFHIACQLGRVLETAPQSHCIVLSKDKGFDPLIRYLNKHGLKCRRINSQLELEPKSATLEEPNFKRVYEILQKFEKRSRPRKRTTLTPYISSIFQKNISSEEVERIIDILFANKLISESNNVISYGF